jgi:hypothetical protein
MPNRVSHSAIIAPQEYFGTVLGVLESLPITQELGLRDFQVENNRIKFWTAWQYVDIDKLKNTLEGLLEEIYMEIAWENYNSNEYGYLVLTKGSLTIIHHDMGEDDMFINDDAQPEPAGKFREFLIKNSMF